MYPAIALNQLLGANRGNEGISEKGIQLEPVRDIPTSFGINLSCVKRNTFSDPPELTSSVFIEHIRNALSHPTYPEKSPRHPSTGYTTMPDGSGIISRLCFIDSPWV